VARQLHSRYYVGVREQTEVAHCLEVLFKELMHVGGAEVMAALVDHDLSFTQARVLFTLAKVGRPMPINELATHVGQSVAAAGRNVDSLVRVGLVERNESPADRRVKLVSISTKGYEVVDQQISARRNAIRAFVARLPVDQSRSLLTAMRPIVAGFDPACHPQMKEPHV
jgi:DNA-binding MarR family transcriptional regulator